MPVVRPLRRLLWLGLACAACTGDGDQPSLYGCGGVDPEHAIEVVYPNGGEIWAKSRAVDIRWQAGEQVESVRIELLDGEDAVATISESELNDGVLEGYVVPAALPERDGYRVRISSADDASISDVSDSDFRIETRDVALSAPNGGEQLLAGEPAAITWSTVGAVDEVDLEIVSDEGEVAVIAQGVPNSGELVWTPSFDLPPAADYRVRIVDPAAEIDDQSDGVFLLDNWRFRRPVTITATSTAELTDFAVLVELEPSDPVFANAAASGADIRFASDPARPAGHDIVHYAEQWSAVDGARIWVVVPRIPAEGEVTLQMYYGAPTAATTSDRETVFPNRFVSNGDLNLGGVHEYDTFHLRANDDLEVEPGEPLEIRARIIDIEGWIDGNGAGYSGGLVGRVGEGPGGGGTSTTGAGGGAGYGGHGGYGGGDPGDAPGSGGPAYGGATGSDVAMGSGGGASDVHGGGDGGGSITLRAHTVTISGWVEANGLSGGDCVSSRCGGGGAGGGILVAAHQIRVTGEVVAMGGNGGDGYGATDDGGGGGGGGRIKLFYGGALEDAGLLRVDGGDGGYASSDGEPGVDGTLHLQAQARWEPIAEVGPEEALFP